MNAWASRALREVTETVAVGPFGSSIKVETFVKNGVPIISGQHLRGVRLDDSPGYNFISEEHASKLKRSIVGRGDVVLTHAGTIGQVAIIPPSSEYDRYVISQRQFFIRCREDVLDPMFLTCFLRSAPGQHALLANASFSGVPSIAQPSTYVRTLLVPVPPLTEQQAITDVLGAFEDKIAVNRRVASLAEQYLRTEIDQAWLQRPGREALLTDFVILNPPTAKPTDKEPLYIDMRKLPESGWSIAAPDRREAKGGARFRRGDTLLARITPCLENRKAGFVDNINEEDVAIGSTEFIVMRARGRIAPPIAFLLATESRFREFAIQYMAGTSGRQRVSASDLARFELPKPREDWLADFGSRATSLFNHVESLHKENATLASTRDAILPQLMSGRLRVREAEAAASAAGV